jgi:hypothetical protein
MENLPFAHWADIPFGKGHHRGCAALPSHELDLKSSAIGIAMHHGSHIALLQAVLFYVMSENYRV